MDTQTSLTLLIVITIIENVAGVCHYDCGKCPEIHPRPRVNWKMYSGKWVKFYGGRNLTYKCAEFKYFYKPGKRPEYVVTTKAKRLDGTPFTSTDRVILGNRCQKPNADYMEGPGVNKHVPNLQLFVLKTDYQSYTIEYGCSVDKSGKKYETLSVQSRSYKLPVKKSYVKRVLRKNGINPNVMTENREKRC